MIGTDFIPMNWPKQKRLYSSQSGMITAVLCILIALINGLDLVAGNGLITITLKEGIYGRPIDLLLFPFRVSGSWIFLLLFVYIYWSLGKELEEEMGETRYGFYLLCGYLFVLAGTLFYPVSALYVFLSIFLAVSWRAPDREILFFWILPLKMKFASLIVLCSFLYSPLVDSFLYQKSIVPLLGPFLGLSNFLVFHLGGWIQKIRNKF